MIIPKVKDPKYLEFIRSCPCAFCNKPGPSEPHHVRGVDGLPGTSRTPSDHLALPACRVCHDRSQGYFDGFDREELLKKIVFHLSEYIIARTKKGGRPYAEIIFGGKTWTKD